MTSPAPTRIDFIHRSFQEYLAGKAAVENDEIGALLLNAHNDHWRDVVLMAVGHAQHRQRSEILKGLIERSAESGDIGKKMKLLAIACLQSAPRMEPNDRRLIEDMARDLIPPTSFEIASSLAPGGDLILDLLMDRPPQTTEQAAASVRVASLVGGQTPWLS